MRLICTLRNGPFPIYVQTILNDNCIIIYADNKQQYVDRSVVLNVPIVAIRIMYMGGAAQRPLVLSENT